MKLFRKPSIKKSISARTTGAWTRKAKRYVNPFYGKKGMGLYTNPPKHFYNKGYSRATQSAYKSTRGKNAGIGIGGLSAFIIILFFVSCFGSVFNDSNDNKRTDNALDKIEESNTSNDKIKTDTNIKIEHSEVIDTSSNNMSESTMKSKDEIETNEPSYYSDYTDEELAINRYVKKYINSNTVCQFEEEKIEDINQTFADHKVLLSFGNRFENNIYLFIEGYYHTKHYFTLEIRGSGANDDELIIHLKDCISVIYPDLSEDELAEIINYAKEAGESGYIYNDDFRLNYSCIEYVEGSRHYSYIITYK